MLSSLNLNFCTIFFWHNLSATVFRADTGNNRKIVDVTFICLLCQAYESGWLIKILEFAKQLLSNF